VHRCASGYSWLVYWQLRAVSKSRIKINIDNAMFQNHYSISRMTFHISISRINFNIRRLNVKINIKNLHWLKKIQDQYSKSRFSKHFLKIKINIKNYHDLFSDSKSKSIVILTCFQNQNQEQFQESRSKFKNQDSCPSLVFRWTANFEGTGSQLHCTLC